MHEERMGLISGPYPPVQRKEMATGLPDGIFSKETFIFW
jgi:hypothetical protein